jgi:plasmid stabilization system protein ParE
VTLPVVWLPEAEAELRHARDWYDTARTELGNRFAAAVEETVEAIAEHPLQFPIVHRGRRRAGVRRFPRVAHPSFVCLGKGFQMLSPKPAGSLTFPLCEQETPTLAKRRLG